MSNDSIMPDWKINISDLNAQWNWTDWTNMSCHNEHDSPLGSTAFQAVIYLMYTTVFAVALIGNGLVCYVVLFSAQMHSVTNLFIMNMAVGDLLMTLFCVPFSFVSTLVLQYWPFGNDLCHTVSFAQAIAVLVSAYTLVAISVDRYIAIMWPLKPRAGKHHAKYIIALVWIVAILTALPILLFTTLHQPLIWHKKCDIYVCIEIWPNQNVYHVYNVAMLVLQYCIPFAVLLFTYISIGVVVWGKRTPGEAQNSRDVRMAKSKRKMIKMMVTVVIAFTVCWLPYNILLMMLDREPSLSTWKHLPYMWFVFHWLAMSHTCYNPVIYCWMNTRYRTGFAAVLRNVPGCGRCMDGYLRAQQLQFHRYSHNDPSQAEGLHRINTTTSYVSVRQLKSHNGTRHAAFGRSCRNNWNEETL
ncbi:Zinc finger C2H2-type,Neuropeptide Y receptor family,G protein-coupled receptor, rhodopsin-like,GPCR [Cinara cedri]|uniref:Zinc finger C2H2-type,Neuropeptide Y receptor family,G protein-coupled receptor, rhodopsin-like,GPCR n=1 Tax=Cinara cedri TaxID=506608 RepID=A0A5E4MTZ1_9HEMI|nr:Zinc finger C2H2-type,Neuropeptide Y receptor family,G protein-coupled receptor, rhodopsin-like,GPCR [Cinara cedri]